MIMIQTVKFVMRDVLRYYSENLLLGCNDQVDVKCYKLIFIRIHFSRICQYPRNVKLVSLDNIPVTFITLLHEIFLKCFITISCYISKTVFQCLDFVFIYIQFLHMKPNVTCI